MMTYTGTVEKFGITFENAYHICDRFAIRKNKLVYDCEIYKDQAAYDAGEEAIDYHSEELNVSLAPYFAQLNSDRLA